MQINWLTVVAQIINFMILVVLLKRFLYGPIIRVMEERQERIIQEEKTAQEKISVAESEAREYNEKTARLDEEKEGILIKARKEAEQERKDYLNKARAVIDEQRRAWEQAIDQEKRLYLLEFKRQIGRQSCLVARRVLEDLANADLEKLIITTFIDKLKNLDDKEKSLVNESLIRHGKVISINSAFVIDEESTKELTAVIHDKFEHIENTHYVVSPDLLCGIELEVNGYHLGWSINEYLKVFEGALLQGVEYSHQQSSEQISEEPKLS